MALLLPEGKGESSKRRIPAWPNGSSGWLSGYTPERTAADPGSNPGPGENFSLKLLIYDLPESYSES